MSICSGCNYLIDDDDWCLKFPRSLLNVEKLKKTLSSGKCDEFKPKQLQKEGE